MIARAVLLGGLLALPGLSQIQLFQFDGTNDTAVATLDDIGTATPGDTVNLRFHVRDVGTASVTLTTLSLSGAGFSITTHPSVPYIIAPGSAVEFDVAFQPSGAGTYSAFLLVNSINLILRGTALPGAVLTLAGSSTSLPSGAAIDFGSLIRGGSKLQALTLSNPNPATMTVAALQVSGTGFRGPIGATAPIQIAPNKSVSFQIAFEPLTGQALRGTLTLDQRSFVLTGQGLDPPLPGASILLSSNAGVSAQQNTVSIPLGAASQVSGTGTLTMSFHSSVAGVADDAAIQFLSGPLRAATVTVSPGDTVAKFGTQPNIAFQTGTTAGTIIFILTLPNGMQQSSLTIAPAAVGFDTAGAVRLAAELDVSFTGFDNTYSASQLAFTFYNKAGVTLQPGVIRVDATSYFRLYFASSKAGGMFALLAQFPVTGDVSQVASVDLQITNAAGAVTTQRINFP